MNFYKIRLIADLNRTLSNSSVLLKVLTIWASLSFVIVGFFGIFPQVRLLISNFNSYAKIIETNKLLNEKVAKINLEYAKIIDNESSVNLLDNYLPDSFNIQNYIVDTSFAAAKYGFQLNDLVVQGNMETGNGVVALTNFEGIGNFGDLVNSIESLKRVSQVSKLKFVVSGGERKATLELNIYSLGAYE